MLISAGSTLSITPEQQQAQAGNKNQTAANEQDDWKVINRCIFLRRGNWAGRR
jgi:hypothetical protein